MADHTSDPYISLPPHSRWGSIFAGDTLIAVTRNAIELRESGYPHRQYVPREDVDMSKLSVSATVTHCPFKGDITYYSLETVDDVAWSYERFTGEMQAIAGRLAFDASKLTKIVCDLSC